MPHSSSHSRHSRRAPTRAPGHRLGSSSARHARAGWQRFRRQFSSRTRTVMLLSALATAMVTLPFGISARLERARLRESVITAQARANALQRELDTLRGAGAVSPSPLLRASPVPEAPTNRPAAAPRSSPPPRPTAVATVTIPDEEARLLREAIALLPSGVRRNPDPSAPASTELAPFADELASAYMLLESGRNAEAGQIFSALTAAWPEWPYAHYYLAVATRTRAPMTQACRLFARMELLGPLPPEADLYWGLAALFTGEDRVARDRFTGIGERLRSRLPALGPLYRPAPFPAELRPLFAETPSLANARIVDRLTGPR